MSNPWAACDRCGFTVRHYTCRTEWTGLFVCGACWDARPPQLDAPYIDPKEGAPLPNARLDPTPLFVEDGEVTEDDL